MDSLMKALGIDVKIIDQGPINEIAELQNITARVSKSRGYDRIEEPQLFLGILAFYKNFNGQVENAGKIRKIIIDNFAKKNVDGAKIGMGIAEVYPSYASPDEIEDLELSEDVLNIFKEEEEISKEEERPLTALDITINLLRNSDHNGLLSLFTHLGYDVQGLTKFQDDVLAELLPLKAESNKGINRVQELEERYPTLITNLNRKVKNEEIVDVLGDNTNNKIAVILSSKVSKSVALVGPAGTGKTHAVRSFVKSINEGTVEKGFEGYAVYELNNVELLADKMGFEESFQELLLDFENHGDKAILFIDEFHSLTGAHTLGTGAADIMKPIITDGKLRTIIATTDSEFNEHVEKDKAITRRFHKVNITEPNDEELRLILEGTVKAFDSYFGKVGDDNLVTNTMMLSQKYSLELANPAKAIGMLDLAYANAVINGDMEAVIDEDVIESINLKYGIRHIENRTVESAKRLFTEILGQKEPLEQLTRSLMAVEKGLVDEEKPSYSAILSGPSGVGKTETAKILAETFFGSADNLIKLSMGEFKDSISVNKIIGSAPGYVGYNDQTGLLAQVKNKPASVILFDEIEKAHPQVFDVLLNMLDAGVIQDQKGDQVSFRQAIILFTTNLGYSAADNETETVGFVNTRKNIVNKSSEVKRVLEGHFRPEFLNRIDQILVYNRLTDDIIDTLINRYHNEFAEKASPESKKSISKMIKKADLEKIKETAEIGKYGARGVKRAVKDFLVEREMESSFIDESFDFLKELTK